MAQVLQPVQSTMFSFATEPNPSARRPHTPPYTPSRSKIRFERAASPAPSIHPTETISPEKPSSSKHSQSGDAVFVYELNELELAALPDVVLVYPKETEEESDRAMQSDDGGHGDDVDDPDDDDGSDADVAASESGISRRFARMHCDDDSEEARMQRSRRKRRHGKRAGQRVYKRSHSTSINSDSEVTDLDAMDDHDLSRSARRLRRKVEEEYQSDAEYDESETATIGKSPRGHDIDGSPSARAGTRSAAQLRSAAHKQSGSHRGNVATDLMELSD